MRGTCKRKKETKTKTLSTETPQSSVGWLHLRAIAAAVVAAAAAAGDPRHHWLRAARAARYVLLLLPPGPDQQHHHDGDEHGEEQPDHDADDQHQPVAGVLLLVDLPRHDALGDDLPLRVRLLLAAAPVQRDVQDVGATIVAHADLVYHIRHVRGRAPGAAPALREQIRLPADGVVFQASLPDAAVGAAAGTDGVDGVDVPLSPRGHLERDETRPCSTVVGS